MTRNSIWKLAATGLIVAATTSACSTGRTQIGAPSAPGAAVGSPKAAAMAAKFAAQASAAIGKNRAAAAVAPAEAAVAAAPTTAAYRALLGQAYLNSGRFQSAAAAYADAITLGQIDGQTVIGRSLALIASGDNAGAMALVDQHRDLLPASDIGLAQALAGDLSRAAFTLTQSARQVGADPRTRQNLALTLALAGSWVEARMLATQDLAPEKVDARMAEWAALAQLSDASARVGKLIGVAPRADGGMPTRLALAPAAPPVALAAADPAPLAEYAPAPLPVDAPGLASIELPPAAPVADAAPAPAPAPVILAEAAPYRTAPAASVAAAASAVPVRQRVVAAAATPPAERPAAREARAIAEQLSAPRVLAFDSKKPAGWAVQLGAFDKLAIAQGKWSQLVRAHRVLAAYPGSSHAAPVGGRTFYRLTVNGIASRADANRVCGALKAKGQTCFVRQMDGKEQVKWAAAPAGVKLAAR